MDSKGYVTIRLKDSERAELEGLAAEAERSLSAEIRLAIRNHLTSNGPTTPSEQGLGSGAGTEGTVTQ